MIRISLFASGKARYSGALRYFTHDIADGSAIFWFRAVKHNIVNTGADAMKLYTLYMPPHHRDGVIHKTKAEAGERFRIFLTGILLRVNSNFTP